MHIQFRFLFTIAFCSILSTLSAFEIEGVSTRIVNGFVVNITEVPYQATLRRKVASGWAHSCGAVIIAKKAVLSAAHCVVNYRKEPSQQKIVMGTSQRNSGGKSYLISKIYVHENYSDSTLEHDISVLITKSSISFSKSVRAIAVATSNLDLPDGTEAIVTGFGTTTFEGSASPVLLAAQVYIVSQRSCSLTYLGIANITSGMICASGINPVKDACQGDSGGPLVAKNRLIGLVSFGEGCADSVYPGVYTRVSEYELWINRTLRSI